jgi:hypothetical protein
LAKIADTLSEHRAIGRLSQVCERWIYTCVCFALDFDEQKSSGFRYQYSNFRVLLHPPVFPITYRPSWSE